MKETILVILGMLATFTIGYFIGGADATDHAIRYLEEIGLFSRLAEIPETCDTCGEEMVLVDGNYYCLHQDKAYTGDTAK